MRIFLTGATGLIGRKLLEILPERGYEIRALYRNENKRKDLLHLPVEWVKGTLEDPGALENGIRGCDAVIHAAAFAGIYAKPEEIMRQNYEGTKTILNLCEAHRVKKIAYISSAGVFGPSGNGITDENSVNGSFYATPYDRIKSLTEDWVMKKAEEGLPVITVNPTRLYGPGLLNEANSVTILIKKYTEGKWRWIPGDGKAIGNYVYTSDVANGILLALEKGKTGEKYILGGENISYNDFFGLLGKIIGKNYAMFHIPYPVMIATARMMEGWASVTGSTPPITTGLIKKYVQNWNVSSAKAVRELGYQPKTMEEGFRSTLEWLNNAKPYELA